MLGPRANGGALLLSLLLAAGCDDDGTCSADDEQDCFDRFVDCKADCSGEEYAAWCLLDCLDVYCACLDEIGCALEDDAYCEDPAWDYPTGDADTDTDTDADTDSAG